MNRFTDNELTIIMRALTDKKNDYTNPKEVSFELLDGLNKHAIVYNYRHNPSELVGEISDADLSDIDIFHIEDSLLLFEEAGKCSQDEIDEILPEITRKLYS